MLLLSSVFLYVIEAEGDDFEEDVDEDFLPISFVVFVTHSCFWFLLSTFYFRLLSFWNSGAKVVLFYGPCKKSPDLFIFSRGLFHICTQRGSGIG